MGRLVKEVVKKTTYKYDENGNVIEKVEEITEKKYEEEKMSFPGLNEPWKTQNYRDANDPFAHGPVIKYEYGKAIEHYES